MCILNTENISRENRWYVMEPVEITRVPPALRMHFLLLVSRQIVLDLEASRLLNGEQFFSGE
jgi:hypothetical protein